MENILWYKQEADCFEKALPIGNGRMGGMVYSKTETERISLNEDTIWSGCEKPSYFPENPAKALSEAQKLVLEGKIYEAENILSKDFSSCWSQIYLPLGDIYLDFNHKDVTNYKRSLNLETGICRTQYVCNGVLYSREVFASHPNDVIVIKISADKEKSLNFSFNTKTQLKVNEKTFRDNISIIKGECPYSGCGYKIVRPEPLIYSDSEHGVCFSICTKLDTDGKVMQKNENIFVADSTNAVIYISVKTSFNGHNKNPYYEGREYENSALRVLEKLNLSSYEDILKCHIEDFSSLYNRTKLDLGSKKSELDTYERLKAFDGNDPGLYELLFGYGRYLSVSCSRKETQAANLQGIWNEKLTPPWSSNYTININTQMNYWHIFNTNLAECFQPFVSLAKKLQDTGRDTAKRFYNANGFVSHHNTDLWGMSNPVGLNANSDSCMYSFWNMSSGWICCQLFDLYEYTMDKALLEEIFPVMCDAALFYTDIMYNEDGKYFICPSTSPENQYLRGEQVLSVSKSTTMTTSILRELFTRVIKASEILRKDFELIDRIKMMLPKIPKPEIAPDGRLMEWAYDETEKEQNHRHTSHLYSLYPGNMITKKDTPQLAEACKKSLLARGDNGTGWSLGWKINLWAYLKDGNHALKLLNMQLKLVEPSPNLKTMDGGGTFPNMFDAHPPFQIDGNFGASAGICNMLMQSEVGYIELLPALPDLWENGEVSGIVAKGNVKINMKWKNKKVTYLSLSSPVSQAVNLFVNGKEIEVKLEENKEKEGDVKKVQNA